jgi:hypothetical protein
MSGSGRVKQSGDSIGSRYVYCTVIATVVVARLEPLLPVTVIV